MSATPIRYIATTLILLFFCTDAEAQSFARIREDYRSRPPKVILVQLFTHQRRKEYYKANNQPKNLKQVTIDADSITRKMVLDFKDNFTFCPYYFFYDTNAAKIRKREFDGVLYDKDMNAVSNSPIAAGDTNYFIVYYGRIIQDDTYSSPSWGSTGIGVLESSTDQILQEEHNLIVLTPSYKQVPRVAVRKAQGYSDRRSLKKDKRAYRYVSPTLNMSYRTRAGALSNNFKAFYGRAGWDEE